MSAKGQGDVNDKRAAYHEAGHAVAFVVLGGHVTGISIVAKPGVRAWTKTSAVPVAWPPLERVDEIVAITDDAKQREAIETSRAETGHAPAPADAVSNARKRGVALIAGELAVTKVLGEKYDARGASGDTGRVRVLATVVSGSEEEACRRTDEWEKAADELAERPAFRRAVEALVKRLLDKKTLDGDEVHDIVEPYMDENSG